MRLSIETMHLLASHGDMEAANTLVHLNEATVEWSRTNAPLRQLPYVNFTFAVYSGPPYMWVSKPHHWLGYTAK